MAKTKLVNAAEAALKELAAQMDAIDKIFQGYGDFEDSDLQKMDSRYTAAENALKALATHLAKLQKRQDDPKVSDRIKGLKNIFKNKQELASKRQAAGEKLSAMQKRLKSIKKSVDDTKGVVEHVRQNYS